MLAICLLRITMSHMTQVVPVRLSATVLQQLEDEAQAAGLSRSEIIRHALAEHFRQRAKDDFRRLTARNRARLSKSGLHSEDDVIAALDS
ncbi:MAG: ribbon-helix-helix protein, CopG family [Planctomycetota bacterium]|nr:MAG: ribbon-helix-helix protein, CopG family [Planctomycetota bacterium]